MSLSHIAILNKNTVGNFKPCKSPLSEINTANPVFITYEHIDGSIEYTYHVNLIHLLDRLFIYDYYDALSIEQEKFIKRYLKEADNIENMSEDMKQLDIFLGGYVGVDNGKYSR